MELILSNDLIVLSTVKFGITRYYETPVSVMESVASWQRCCKFVSVFENVKTGNHGGGGTRGTGVKVCAIQLPSPLHSSYFSWLELRAVNFGVTKLQITRVGILL